MNAKEFFDGLRDDEVEALRGLISIVVVAGRGDAAEGVKAIKEAITIAQQAKGTARSVRWLAVILLGLMTFGSAIIEQAGKWVHFFRGLK